MFDILFKKKLSESKLAEYFVSSVFHLVDSGFSDVIEIIKNDTSFERVPSLEQASSDEFLMIVISGNLHFVPGHFNDYQDVRILDAIYKHLGEAFSMSSQDVKSIVRSYQSYFKRINHPSKNMHYAMSKAVFYKYNLNDFQESYFRNMETPNPILLKRLDELMANFLFSWEDVRKNFKVIKD